MENQLKILRAMTLRLTGIKLKDGNTVMAYNSPGGAWSYNWNDDDNFKMLYEDGNTAMLGVVTESEDDGLKITDVTEGSGADKAGLKEDDIITKVDDKKVDDPDDLTKLIRSHKPGDKVNITYLRDKKEQKLPRNWVNGKDQTLMSICLIWTGM